MVDRWTNSDESQLQALIKRKEELHQKNYAPLYSFVQSLRLEDCTNKEITEFLISKSDKFRDLLEPFDSGCRVAKD